VTRAKGGLHYINGNDKHILSHGVQNDGTGPVFGCIHEQILAVFRSSPRWRRCIYQTSTVCRCTLWQTAGFGCRILGGCGEQFHGGNSKTQPKTPDECLDVVAEYLRVTRVRASRSRVRESQMEWPDMKACFAGIVEQQKPRWKVEARTASRRWT